MRLQRTLARLPLCALLLLVTATAASDSLEQATPLAQSGDAATQRYTVSTTKSYDDALMDLEFAITEHNYRITGRNRIGQAIANSEAIDFPQSTVVHFCNLRTAKAVLNLDPDFLLHMPCRISLRDRGDSILVEARLVPETDPRTHAIALEINAMLRDIADYAAR